MNKLYRSNTNRIVSGVCGGIAEYLSIDVSIVRIIFVIASIITGLGFIVYIAATLLIPPAPVGYEVPIDRENNFSLETIDKKTIGMILIALGVVLTLKRILQFDDIIITSIVLIGVGIYIILKGGDKR